MGLFEEIQNQSSNYISIGFAVEGLASHEGGLYKAVMVMLHYRFDELLSCYKKDEFHTFIDIDNDQLEEYSAFQILNDIKKYAESIGGIDSKECYLSEEFKTKIQGYYWNFEAYFNLEPMKSSVDTYHQKQEFTKNDYKFFLFKKPLLTFHEASCIMTGYDPQYVEQCQNDTDFKQNFSNYLGAKDYIDTCCDAQMLCYNPMDNRIDGLCCIKIS